MLGPSGLAHSIYLRGGSILLKDFWNIAETVIVIDMKKLDSKPLHELQTGLP